MDGGDLVYPLPLIAAVVDTLGVAALLQSPVANISPCAAPFLGFGLLVPVSGRDRFALVLPRFRIVDFAALLVKNVLLFLLRAPLAALLKGAHGKHDMSVRVAAARVMYGKVGAHSRRHKIAVHILADKGNALLPCQLHGQRDFNLPRKL